MRHSLITFAPFYAAPDGASGPGPVSSKHVPWTVERAQAALEKIGLTVKGGPQFQIKMSTAKVLDKGKQKGHTFQRVCDVALTLKSGLPFSGCGLAMMRDPKGNVSFVWMWPSTGSGVFSRSVIDAKGNGNRENPQYPSEAKIMEEIGEYYAGLGVAFLKAENKAGRGINTNKGLAVREGAVHATAGDLADLGFSEETE